MKNRRGFLLALVAGLMAAAVIITPVIAEELIGVITKVDVAGKKLTVVEKGTDKEVVVTTTRRHRVRLGQGREQQDRPGEDLQEGGEGRGCGQEGRQLKVTHEKGVASKIESAKKKAN